MNYTNYLNNKFYIFELKYEKDNKIITKAVRYKTTRSKVQKELYNWVVDNEKYNNFIADTYTSYLDNGNYIINQDDFGNSWAELVHLK